MNLEVTGKLIVKNDTVQVSEKFKKRMFVLELSEDINGNTYTNYAQFQCVQNKCDILDHYNVGDTAKVSFNLKGNRWEKDGKVNYITNLDVWKIEGLETVNQKPQVDTGYGKLDAMQPSDYNQTDTLPF